MCLFEWYYSLNRTSTDDEDSFSSDNELLSYVNGYFWPRIQSCTIRLIYSLRDAGRDQKSIERQWALNVRFDNIKRIIYLISFFLYYS